MRVKGSVGATVKEGVKKRMLGCEGDSVGACPTPNPSECELLVKISCGNEGKCCLIRTPCLVSFC